MHRYARPRLAGPPLPDTDGCLVDPDDPDQLVACGRGGDLLGRRPQVFQGYLNNPEATAASFHGDWFRTGDAGVMEEDGFVRLVARIKEIIITGGFNVYPAEVEEAMSDHRDIESIAVVGRPREDGSEDVVA